MMRLALLPLVLALAAAGCATSSIQSRRDERLGAYNSLPAEQRLAVDSGQIKVGMTEDAVYIAMGKPSQILRGENAAGAMTTWLYFGTTFDEFRTWNMPYQTYYGRWYGGPYISYHYAPRSYVRAEVRFEAGVVKEWRSLPEPGR